MVSKIFPPDQLVNEAIKLGEKIAKNSPIILKLCKESINTAYETTLKEGIHFERMASNGTFATKDCKEGMNAFVEKRTPNFTGE